MRFEDKYIVSPEFEDLFVFGSEQEELEYEAKMMMFRFFSAFESALDEPLKRKELARILKKSPSYITQLFRGDKIVNLTTLAQIEKEFNITFDIQVRKKEDSDASKEDVSKTVNLPPLPLLPPQMDLQLGDRLSGK